MMMILQATVLAVIACFCDCEVLSGSVSEELVAYKNRALQLQRFITRECPQLKEAHNLQILVDHASASQDLEIKKSTYKDLMNILIDCRAQQEEKSTSIHTTSPTPTPTTTHRSIRTSTQRLPGECMTARNLTESWRLDQKGSGIRPGGPHSNGGWACDLYRYDTRWFRFAGAAGNNNIITINIFIISS